MNKKIKGQLFVISAPSGAGKSSLISDLISKGDTLELSISATTRSARKGEENAKHYFFIEDSEFDALKSKGAFIENACVHGHVWGLTGKEKRQLLFLPMFKEFLQFCGSSDQVGC